MNPLPYVLQLVQGWKDGTAAKSSYCSCTGPACSFLAPTWGSQLSATLVLGDPMPYSGFHGLLHNHSTHKLMQAYADKKTGNQAKTATVDGTEVQS